MQEVANLWRSAARTDTGKVRARNEDAFLALPEQGLWVVADGMGGHQNGALASRLIVEQLAEPSAGDLPQRLDELRKRLHSLNRRLGQELTVTAAHPDPVIGSTVVALLIEGDRAACVWAGDSRCYRLRAGNLEQLTIDHSMINDVIEQRPDLDDVVLSSLPQHALFASVTTAPPPFAEEGLPAVPPDASRYSAPPYRSNTALLFFSFMSTPLDSTFLLVSSARDGSACTCTAPSTPSFFSASHAKSCVSASPTASPLILAKLSPANPRISAAAA